MAPGNGHKDGNGGQRIPFQDLSGPHPLAQIENEPTAEMVRPEHRRHPTGLRLLRDIRFLAVCGFGLVGLGFGASRFFVPTQDVTDIKQQVAQLQQDDSATKTHLDDHDREFEDMNGELKGIGEDIRDIRSDLERPHK